MCTKIFEPTNFISLAQPAYFMHAEEIGRVRQTTTSSSARADVVLQKAPAELYRKWRGVMHTLHPPCSNPACQAPAELYCSHIFCTDETLNI